MNLDAGICETDNTKFASAKHPCSTDTTQSNTTDTTQSNTTDTTQSNTTDTTQHKSSNMNSPNNNQERYRWYESDDE